MNWPSSSPNAPNVPRYDSSTRHIVTRVPPIGPWVGFERLMTYRRSSLPMVMSTGVLKPRPPCAMTPTPCEKRKRLSTVVTIEYSLHQAQLLEAAGHHRLWIDLEPLLQQRAV